MAQRINLREDITRQTRPLAVDRDAGIIRGVKLCGITSRNGRKYPIGTLREAVKLYDGKACNVNHTKKGEQASVESRFGEWRNPDIRDDGIYADLHYLKSHTLAATTCEVAERMPRQLGFSHNADGDAEFKEGSYVVTKIHDVHSADLVANPATTQGMFEDIEPPTLRRLLESGDWSTDQHATVCELLEVEGLPLDAVPPAGDDADPQSQVTSAFEAALTACIKECLEGHVQLSDCMTKVRKLLKSHADLNGNAVPGDNPVDKDKYESLDRENATLREELAARDECDKAGVKFAVLSEAKRQAILTAKGKARTELIEAFKPPVPTNGKPPPEPQSRAPRSPLRESVEPSEEVPQDRSRIQEWLTGKK